MHLLTGLKLQTCRQGHKAMGVPTHPAVLQFDVGSRKPLLLGYISKAVPEARMRDFTPGDDLDDLRFAPPIREPVGTLWRSRATAQY